MKNSRVNLVAATCVLVFASYASADEIVAVLDLKFIEETDKVAALMCFGENNEDCDVWAMHYLFEAKVDKVISGELPEKRFPVLYGRHAMKKENYRNVVVMLKRLDAAEESDPQYRILQWGEKRDMYCFDQRFDVETEVAVEVNSKHQLNCFDPDLNLGKESFEIQQ